MDKEVNLNDLTTSDNTDLWSESMESLTPQETKTETKVEVKELEEVDNEEGEEEIQEDIEEEGENDEDDNESEEEEESDDADVKDEAEEITKKEPNITYKATKSDGEQVEIDSSTIFKVKLNGRFEKVKFEDLKKSYAGKTFYDEKIRRASEKEKKIEAREAEIIQSNNRFSQKLEAMKKAMSEENVISILGEVADLVQQDRAEFISANLKAMSSFIQEFANKSEQEQATFLSDLKYENLKKDVERKETETREKEDLAKTNKEIDDICSKYQISKDELKTAYQALTKFYTDKGYDINKITLENVVDLNLEARIKDNIKIAEEESKTQLTVDQFNKFYLAVFKEEKENGSALELADYLDIIKTVTGKEKTHKASKALEKKVKKEVKPKKKEAEEDTPMDINEIWGF